MFLREYDILVAGGGVAGVAAALEAARAGHRVGLIEKTVLPGGLATTGLVNVYLPLCDGYGTQVTFGLAEELLRLSIRYGPGAIPAQWCSGDEKRHNERYRVTFSPAAFVLGLDEVLEKAAIDLWYDTLICTTITDADRVAGVEVENKSGRGRLLASCVVDATGDADVTARAGAACHEADNWQGIWSLEIKLDHARSAAENGDATPLTAMTYTGAGPGNQNVPGLRKLLGTDGQQVSEFVTTTRRMLRERYAKSQAGGGANSRNNCYPVAVPGMAQFRTTRCIVGRDTVVPEACGRAVPDSVGMISDWRRGGQVWEVPYGALVPEKTEGLIAAGRCVASMGDAWEVTRVIPAAVLTGQAAGAAASLTVERATTPAALDVRDLQARLRERGVVLHLTDVGL